MYSSRVVYRCVFFNSRAVDRTVFHVSIMRFPQASSTLRISTIIRDCSCFAPSIESACSKIRPSLCGSIWKMCQLTEPFRKRPPAQYLHLPPRLSWPIHRCHRTGRHLSLVISTSPTANQAHVHSMKYAHMPIRSGCV
jgi:hypothetical protein